VAGESAKYAWQPFFRSQNLELLARLQRVLGRAVVLIAHDMVVPRQAGDRGAVTGCDAVVEKGAWDTVYDEPQALHKTLPAASRCSPRPRQRRRAAPDIQVGAAPERETSPGISQRASPARHPRAVRSGPGRRVRQGG
jgi:ABC-type glutathione transport system ATPase component